MNELNQLIDKIIKITQLQDERIANNHQLIQNVGKNASTVLEEHDRKLELLKAALTEASDMIMQQRLCIAELHERLEKAENTLKTLGLG